MARTAGGGAAWILAYGEAAGRGTENGAAPARAFDRNCLVKPMIVAAAIGDVQIRLPGVTFFVFGLDVLVEEGFALFFGRGTEQPNRGRSQAGMGVEHREALFELLGL